MSAGAARRSSRCVPGRTAACSTGSRRADADLTRAMAHVRAVSPAATLARGYAVVQDQAGTLVRDCTAVSVGQPLDIRLAAGRLSVDVTRTMPAPLNPPARRPGPGWRQGGSRAPGRTS